VVTGSMASQTWILGIRTLPAAVHEDEPAVVVWLTEDQVLAFRHLDEDAPTDADLKETFEQAQHAPLIGDPIARPRKIRVESGGLAKRVRALFRGIDVEIGRTSAVDRFLETVIETALADRREGLALLEAAPEFLRTELIGLAAELEEASPWDVLPIEPLAVRIPSLELADGRLGAMGDDGDTFGLMLFFSPEDEALFAHAETLDPEASPRCLAAKLGELPNDDGTYFDAFVPKAFDRGLSVPCSERELRIFIAAARALCLFVAANADALIDGVMEEGASATVSGSFTVEVAGEPIEVHFSTTAADPAPA